MKKEGWFIVDRFPVLTADALPVTDALEDTGILIIEDEEPDEPIVYDSLPRLMDVGNWKEFPHDPMQPIEWKELRILRPNTNSITITNNSPLWMLEVREQIGAGDLLFTAVIKPSDTHTYQFPVAVEIPHHGGGFGVLFHFDRPDDTESLVYVRENK